jgi:hypothetical protein
LVNFMLRVARNHHFEDTFGAISPAAPTGELEECSS